jgi:hypothetical protein
MEPIKVELLTNQKSLPVRKFHSGREAVWTEEPVRHVYETSLPDCSRRTVVPCGNATRSKRLPDALVQRTRSRARRTDGLFAITR